MSFRAISLLLFLFLLLLLLLLPKRHGIFYTSAIPEVTWYEPLYNGSKSILCKVLELISSAILYCLSSAQAQWKYSVSSFRDTLVGSFCAFLSFWTLMLVVFLLLHRETVFTSARSLLSTNVSYGILGLALCLVGIHSAAVYLLALTKLSYSSFRVCFSDISWSTSNLILTVNVYLSLIPQSLRRD